MNEPSGWSGGGPRNWLMRWRGRFAADRPVGERAFSPDIKQSYLSETDIFRDLTAEEMSWVSERTTMITAKKGQVIYGQEEPAEVLFILKRGRIQVYRLASDGRKLVISILGPGTIFGEMSLIGQRMYSGYAEALDDVTLCVMSQTDLERVVIDKPQVAIRLLDVMSQRIRAMEAQLERIAFKSVSVRLAHVLIRLAGATESRVLAASHQELAEMVGASRETTTRALDEFQHAGIVALGRRSITIRDSDRLREIARG